MKRDISLITPISKDLLYVKIADSILEVIKNNNLQTGDKLPSERTLAANFGTSRHSVREALRVLENQGVLVSHMGSGTYVATPNQEKSLYLDTVKINYLEMLGIKTELEKYAARLIIENRNQTGIQDLEKLLEIMEEKGHDGLFAFSIDKQFHYLIADISSNSMLAQMIKKMIEVLDDYIEVIPQSVGLCLDTICWHRSILEGLSSADTEKVCHAYDKILEIDKRVIKENYK